MILVSLVLFKLVLVVKAIDENSENATKVPTQTALLATGVDEAVTMLQLAGRPHQVEVPIEQGSDDDIVEENGRDDVDLVEALDLSETRSLLNSRGRSSTRGGWGGKKMVTGVKNTAAQTGEVISKETAKTSEVIAEETAKTADAFNGAATSAYEGARDYSTALGNGVMEVGATLGDVEAAAWCEVGKAASEVKSAAKALAESAEAATNAVAAVGDDWATAAPDVVEKATDAVENAVDSAVTFMEGVGELAFEAAEAVWEKVKELGEFLVSLVLDAKEFLLKVIKKIADFGTLVGKQVQEVGDAAIQELKNKGGVIVKIFEKTGNTLGGVVSEVVAASKGVLGDVGLFTAILGTLGEGVVRFMISLVSGQFSIPGATAKSIAKAILGVVSIFFQEHLSNRVCNIIKTVHDFLADLPNDLQQLALLEQQPSVALLEEERAMSNTNLTSSADANSGIIKNTAWYIALCGGGSFGVTLGMCLYVPFWFDTNFGFHVDSEHITFEAGFEFTTAPSIFSEGGVLIGWIATNTPAALAGNSFSMNFDVSVDLPKPPGASLDGSMGATFGMEPFQLLSIDFFQGLSMGVPMPDAQPASGSASFQTAWSRASCGTPNSLPFVGNAENTNGLTEAFTVELAPQVPDLLRPTVLGQTERREFKPVMSIKPRGSPSGCKCAMLVLGNYLYSAGNLMKCEGCTDIFRSTDTNSCPAGWKIISPASQSDWTTVQAVGGLPSNPDSIVDVTRSGNGCGGCTGHAMNSGSPEQRSWRTSDGSPWFLRSSTFGQPEGDYEANCYLKIYDQNPSGITFNDHNCNYHSKDYLCQPEAKPLTPASGRRRRRRRRRRGRSPCKCVELNLGSRLYSAGKLAKCTGCKQVSQSTQANSCPRHWKIFSPQSESDWVTVREVGGVPAKPNHIVDVTRSTNGCGGCTQHAMNSGSPEQRSWRTSDGSPWFLRSSTFGQPEGDYEANCYLKIYDQNPSGITFNDHNCNYHSEDYLCQPVAKSLTPRAGSKASCKCTEFNLGVRGYSMSRLATCTNCDAVWRSTDENSCPAGWKIFAPQSKGDWDTVIAMGGVPGNPHAIVDVTKSVSGGSPMNFPMNSANQERASWRTTDGAKWWLRGTSFSQPSGDYHANCFLGIYTQSNSADITFNDGNCNYHSHDYLCQPMKLKPPAIGSQR